MLPPPLPLPAMFALDAPPASSSCAPVVEGASALASDAQFWDLHEQVQRLGRGCFGSVLLVRSRESHRVAAVKVVATSQKEGDESPLLEPELLRAARHRHVCRLLSVYQSATTLFMLQDAERTDLMGHAATFADGVVGEDEARGYLRGLLSAVRHIHSLRIVHRDIKATNVLLSAQGDVRLADFGLAARLPEHGLLTSVCGTHDYLAPEMVRCGHGECDGYGTSVDLWGVGLLLFSLLCGGNPFERETDIATLQAILAGTFAFPAHRPPPSDSAADLIGRLLVVNPQARLSAAEAIQLPWVRGGEGELVGETAAAAA